MGAVLDSLVPTIPSFREPSGGWDWRQIADMAIPGDVWNSRTNQWRPQGMVAGIADSIVPFGGMAVEAAYAGRNSFRNPLGDWLSARTGRGDRGNLGPSARNPMWPDPRPTLPNFAGSDNWGTANQNQRDPNWRMQGVQNAGPRPMRGGQGGYNGQSWASARGVGQSMRRTNDQILQEQMEQIERWRNRALMQER